MRYGSDVAGACEFGAWTRVAEKVNQAKRRYAKVANIEAKTVTDSLKLLQLPMDSTMGLSLPNTKSRIPIMS